MELHGQTVVVIGGSAGMGFAVAKLAMEQGAEVTIASRSSQRLREAAEQLGSVQTRVVDITREQDISALFHEMERVNHVFVSAARPLFGEILETDLEVFRIDVDQRFMGLLYVVRHAAPKMKQGSITFVTGSFSSRPAVGVVVSSALLAAGEALAKGLALELAPIRANAISPGAIDTLFPGEEGNKEMKQWAEDTLPVKRIGTAEEVAQAALLLMTNGYITGEVLHIDGGGRFV